MTDGLETSELSEVLREMCTEISGAAPERWLQARANGFVDQQGIGLSGVSYRLTAGDEYAVEVDLRRCLRRAYRVSGASEQGLSIELTVDASGRFEAVTGRGVSRVSYPKRGFLYVIEPGTLPPDAGDEQDGPVSPTPAGDPEEAVGLLREYLRRRAELLGGMPDAPTGILPGPLPAARLEEMEGTLNVALPADLRALYGVADGDGQAGLFGRLSWWMDASGVAAVHGGERHWAPRGWARAIAELDGLLYLALRYDQWQELWSHTDRMPALAVAFLAGKTPYDKVADWIAQVNARTIDRRPAAQQTHHGHR